MIELPERILKLRDELFAVKTQTCFERAKALTRSYKNSEGEPQVIRRAKGLRDILHDMPIYIREGELIVGSRSSQLGYRTTFPEYTREGQCPDEIDEYWEGKTIGELSAKFTPEYLNLANDELAACYVTGTRTGFGHMIVDYDKAISKGLRYMIKEAELEGSRASGDRDGHDFCRAVVISCEGVIAWANRYADLAEQLAGETDDDQRRNELLRIAGICRKVPEHPAETFHEALQSFFFTQAVLHIEQKGWSISAGRFDQYIYPFYKHDVDAGVPAEELFELLLNLWVKFMEIIDSEVKVTAFQNLTLGGQDEQGNDMSNELSHLCLDATYLTRFTQPALSVRWHKNIDRDFWLHTLRVIGTGVGMPALFNDNVIIEAFIDNGIPHNEALGYGIVGCVEPEIPGKMQGATAGGHVNMIKALELALFNGRSLTSGKQIGLKTGDASKFETFEELLEAYKKQVLWLSGVNITSAQIAGDSQKMLGHCPFCSSLLDDCISKRKDMVDGGTRYSLSGVGVFGSSNTADSMMVLKKLVFEEKRFTMPEVLKALEADYEGYENMRRMFLNHKIRFGNDIEEADEMANDLIAIHADFTRYHPDPRGGHYTCGIWPVNGHVHSGYHTGATPDGRHSGAPLVDGVGACQGADRNGPTALLKSVARLNNVKHWAAGNTCNIRFSDLSINSDKDLEKMGALVETFMILGGQELQINVVDSATLRSAQEKPEEHQNLVVRVAGYSAYFTLLSLDVQNEIISRVEQSV